MSYLLGLMFVVMRIVSQDYIILDGMAIESLPSIAVKNDQNNTVNFSERTSFRAVETLSVPITKSLKTNCAFKQRHSVLAKKD